MALCAREGHLSFYVFVEKIEAQAMGKAASKLKLARAVIVQVVFMFGQAIGIDQRNMRQAYSDLSLRRSHNRQVGESGWSCVGQAYDELHLRLIKVRAHSRDEAGQACLVLRCRRFVSAVALALLPETGEDFDIVSPGHLLEMTDQTRVERAFVSVVRDCSALRRPFRLPGEQRRTAYRIFYQPQVFELLIFKKCSSKADFGTEAAVTRIQVEEFDLGRK